MASIDKTKHKKSWEKPIKSKAQKQYTTDELAKEYQTARWRKLSALFRIQNPLCVRCLSIGRYTPVAVADHIHSVADGGEMYEWDNLQSLCKSCHQTKTNEDRWGIPKRN